MKKEVMVFSAIISVLVCSLCFYAKAADYSLCDSGCDYSDINSALIAVNNTNSSIYFNQENSSYSINLNGYFNITDNEDDGVFNFNVSNVTLDCGNSLINGTYDQGYVFYIMNINNITIKNCRIEGYSSVLGSEFMKDSRFINISFFSVAGLVFQLYEDCDSNVFNKIINLGGAGIPNYKAISLERGSDNNYISNSTLNAILFWNIPPCNNNVISQSNIGKIFLQSGGGGSGNIFDSCYWYNTQTPYFDCNINANTCLYWTDNNPYKQKDEWIYINSEQGFDAGTTDFDNIPASTNVSSWEGVVLNKGTSKVEFNEGISFVNDFNLNEYITFGTGFVSFDMPSIFKYGNDFNKSANVTIAVPSCNNLVVYHVSDGNFYTDLNSIIANGVDCTTDGSCSNIQCTFKGSYATVTFTANGFDGYGGSSGAVPEFSTITTIIALGIVLVGFFKMRKRL